MLEPTPVIIKLDAVERRFAMTAACARRLYCARNNFDSSYGKEIEFIGQLGSDVCGTFGELAVAKYLDRYWSGAYNEVDDGTDIGPYGVRASMVRNSRLIIHPPNGKDKADPPNVPFIHVRIDADLATARLMGWLYGRDGMDKAKYWPGPNKHRPACYVPICDLKSMTTLPPWGTDDVDKWLDGTNA